MPRYYCDYCDTYLTHDSPSVRKQHNAGYKHKANVREYYQQFEQLQTQSLIDQKIKEHLGQAGIYQVGAAFNQHLAALPGLQRPRLPVQLPPVLPLPVPGARPPVLPRPGVPGYVAPPQMVSGPVQPPIATSLPMQVNGPPGPPTMSAPPSAVPAPSSSGAPPGVPQAPYQLNPGSGAPLPASTPADSYAYAKAPEAGR